MLTDNPSKSRGCGLQHIVLATSLLMCSSLASAYELGTHALVTKTAHDASVLSPTHPKSIHPVLGFDRMNPTLPLADRFDPELFHAYFDNETVGQLPLTADAASEAYIRSSQNIERNIFNDLIDLGLLGPSTGNGDYEGRLEAWLLRGAIREDDVEIAGRPLAAFDPDPWQSQFRVARHFYDPINIRALTDVSCPLFDCQPTTVWALGRTISNFNTGLVIEDRQNHFSWADARNNYWWALTYDLTEFPASEFYEQTASDYRRLRMATMLKSLGQVVHLVQDMAQPQHVRNDGHGPPITTLVTHDNPTDGWFEAFTEARLFSGKLPGPGLIGLLTSLPIRDFNGRLIGVDELPKLQLKPYPVPRFNEPLTWFTSRKTDSVNSARGLADLSNRGFFTTTTLPQNVTSGEPDIDAQAYLNPPLPGPQSTFYSEQFLSTTQTLDGQLIKQYRLLAPVPDVLQPNWNATSGLAQDSSGRISLLSVSQARLASDLLSSIDPIVTSTAYGVSTKEFEGMANLMLSRAAGYSTGLIDYFFRGRLEVTPGAHNVFAVMNQGALHSVDSEGYPRHPDLRVFGFEKVRLKVRNVTEAIAESGTTDTHLQPSSQGVLMAVARYHRNACYRPDLSGERKVGYAAPPQLPAVVEPSCGQPTRTNFEELAISAPLTIDANNPLPGGNGTSSGSAVEFVFDFTADPIPVNATDLFIQVIYRGQLGAEPDGIAVGAYDVREPTFVTAWNNTDYFFNSSLMQWLPQNGAFPRRNVEFLRVCSGAGAESRWMFYAEPVNGFPAIGIATPDPGVLRLAMLFAIPPTPTSNFSVRMTPVMNGAPHAPQRSSFTRGAIRQASVDSPSNTVLAQPLWCSQTAPTQPSYWCNDPILQRRSVMMGHVLAPIYYDTAVGNTGTDVDSVPLPVFSGVRIYEQGQNKFHDAVLSSCPAAPN